VPRENLGVYIVNYCASAVHLVTAFEIQLSLLRLHALQMFVLLFSFLLRLC